MLWKNGKEVKMSIAKSNKIPQKQKAFKSSPKRFQPKGLSIIYEDHDILVVDKVNGLLTISTDKVSDKTAYFLLNDYVKKGNPKSRNQLFIVHRLDKDTSGILVFAKNEKAKRFLQDEWKKFTKTYFAVVHGKLPEKKGIITSYLMENSIHRMYSINNPKKGLLAKTGYKVLKESERFSLLEIDLLTGKKHQIRVHFSEKGFPVVGDKFYGRKETGVKRLALHASTLTILHPFTKEEMTFKTKTPAYFYSLIKF